MKDWDISENVRKSNIEIDNSANAGGAGKVTKGRQDFSELIYKTPAIYVILISVALAVLLTGIAFGICALCGFTFYVDQRADGEIYRYAGFMRGDVPTYGSFQSTDGVGGKIRGNKIKYKDGSSYRGELNKLKFHGNGEYKNADGDIYKGTFHNGLLYGEGEISYADGGKFKGGFYEGKKHGYGEETYADGTSYVGEFEFGEKQGKGKQTYIDGSSYEGEFKNGMRYGRGVYKFASGDSYTGEFQNNVITGYGRYFFTTGRVFVGNFINGVPCID